MKVHSNMKNIFCSEFDVTKCKINKKSKNIIKNLYSKKKSYRNSKHNFKKMPIYIKSPIPSLDQLQLNVFKNIKKKDSKMESSKVSSETEDEDNFYNSTSHETKRTYEIQMRKNDHDTIPCSSFIKISGKNNENEDEYHPPLPKPSSNFSPNEILRPSPLTVTKCKLSDLIEEGKLNNFPMSSFKASSSQKNLEPSKKIPEVRKGNNELKRELKFGKGFGHDIKMAKVKRNVLFKNNPKRAASVDSIKEDYVTSDSKLLHDAIALLKASTDVLVAKLELTPQVTNEAKERNNTKNSPENTTQDEMLNTRIVYEENENLIKTSECRKNKENLPLLDSLCPNNEFISASHDRRVKFSSYFPHLPTSSLPLILSSKTKVGNEKEESVRNYLNNLNKEPKIERRLYSNHLFNGDIVQSLSLNSRSSSISMIPAISSDQSIPESSDEETYFYGGDVPDDESEFSDFDMTRRRENYRQSMRIMKRHQSVPVLCSKMRKIMEKLTELDAVPEIIDTVREKFPLETHFLEFVENGYDELDDAQEDNIRAKQLAHLNSKSKGGLIRRESKECVDEKEKNLKSSRLKVDNLANFEHLALRKILPERKNRSNDESFNSSKMGEESESEMKFNTRRSTRTGIPKPISLTKGFPKGSLSNFNVSREGKENESKNSEKVKSIRSNIALRPAINTNEIIYGVTSSKGKIKLRKIKSGHQG